MEGFSTAITPPGILCVLIAGTQLRVRLKSSVTLWVMMLFRPHL